MKHRYAMLLLPSSNRVYSSATDKLAHAELASFNTAVLENRITQVQTQVIAGVPYLTFTSDELSEQDIAFLSNLSFLYALFAMHGSETEVHMVPIALKPLDRYDSDLLSILKFAGKTNEQFTRLLLNVTIMASELAPAMCHQRLRVFDPVCGRGTTLNQALMYGYHAAGMDIDRNGFDAYSVFINRWLKDKRLKHKSESIELRQHGKTQAHRLGIRLSHDKQAYKADDVQVLDFVLADTVKAAQFFKPGSFDVIVADLPYGVKHGNRSIEGMSKSPIQLLEQALPVWSKLLSSGGAMGLSWNTYLGKKPDIIALLETSGLSASTHTLTDTFRHRVDQAIIRDMVVATRH